MSSAVGGGGWFVIGGTVTFDCAAGVEGVQEEKSNICFIKVKYKENKIWRYCMVKIPRALPGSSDCIGGVGGVGAV